MNHDSDNATIIKEGVDAVKKEAAVLNQLSNMIDENFCEAVLKIAGLKGKVILSGIGKAGLIARKIAATLSSLGTSSFFMHPADASHGDMGMVTDQDIMILMSNSGESEEITSLIPTIKSLNAFLIAFTGRPDSCLGREADITLNLGHIEEICPLGLAPTSSTTAMLALGDALAVCVMNRKPGFDEKRYAIYHPGGSLGKKLLKVKAVMKSGNDIVISSPDETVKDVLFKITSARTGCAVITSSDHFVRGFFSDGDLRRYLKKYDEKALSLPVKDVMTISPKVIDEDAYAMEALKVLKDYRIGDLPVVDHASRLTGIISLKDLVDVGIV